MAFTQEQHDALEAAIAEGAMSVRYGDREVRYRSQKQMLELLDLMKRGLGLTGTGPLRTVVTTRRNVHPAPPGKAFDGSWPLDS